MTSRSIRRLTAVLLSLIFGGLVVFQVVNLSESQGRRVGVSIEQGDEAIRVFEVEEGMAAERAGFEAGDEVVRINGQRTKVVGDWDKVAVDFSPDRTVEMVVRRGDGEKTLLVTPGAPFPMARVGLNLLAVLGYLSLMLLSLLHRGPDLRTRLLFLFSLAVVLELVLPIGSIGEYSLAVVTFTLYYLLTGFEIGVELHLAALIPDRPAWLRRQSWVVPMFYVIGLGLGGTAAATFLLEDIRGLDVFPWSPTQIEDVLLRWALPLWALGVAILLAIPAFRHEQRLRRQQAGLVLAGVVPWLAVLLFTSLLDPEAAYNIAWLQTVESLALLCYPVAVFVAILRFDLFHIELTLRRSVLYGLMTVALGLVFYALIGAGGVVVSNVTDQDASVWLIAGATLVLGLLFVPLMRAIQGWVDRRLFPERTALRAHLVALASELPSLGKLPLMGEHLVSRIVSIFGARSASLFITEPSTEVLRLLADRRPAHEGELDRNLLLPMRDPAAVGLRRLRRPTSIATFRATEAVDEGASPLLQRLEGLGVSLLIPLMSQERLVGLMTLGPRQNDSTYRNEEIELLDLLSLHVATVFENARLFDSATFEGLTGLLRREAILEKLELELQRAQRYDRPLTVGLADLDHFKEINDRWGHLAGDSLLKRISATIEDSLRATDMVGRYGGEEFLLILPETDLQGAQTVAEKVRRAVQEVRLEIDGDKQLSVSGEDTGDASVTVSIGLASLDRLRDEGLTVATQRDLIAAADRALYKAKGSGRNRVHPLLSRAG